MVSFSNLFVSLPQDLTSPAVAGGVLVLVSLFDVRELIARLLGAAGADVWRAVKRQGTR
jgi:hypothetical protein